MNKTYAQRRAQSVVNNLWLVQKSIESPEWLQNPSRVFEAMRAVQDLLKELRRDLVDEMHADGATWEEIGAAMGTTRQYAWQTFSS